MGTTPLDTDTDTSGLGTKDATCRFNMLLSLR